MPTLSVCHTAVGLKRAHDDDDAEERCLHCQCVTQQWVLKEHTAVSLWDAASFFRRMYSHRMYSIEFVLLLCHSAEEGFVGRRVFFPLVFSVPDRAWLWTLIPNKISLSLARSCALSL